MNRKSVMKAIMDWLTSQIKANQSYEIKLKVSEDESYVFDYQEVRLFAAVLYGLLCEWADGNEGEGCNTPEGLLNYCIEATKTTNEKDCSFGFGMICEIYSREEVSVTWVRIG